MSLIRYSSDDSRSVVLRHQQTLVLYDPHSRQIILREASPSSSAEGSPQACPYCKRPIRHGEEPVADSLSPGLGHRPRSSSPLAESGYVDQQYFRMLDASVSIQGSSTQQHGDGTATFSRLNTLESGDEVVSDEEEPSVAQAPVTGIRDSALSPGYFERFFVAEKELGRGGKGVVLLVRHVLDGVFLGKFACKRVPVGNNHDWLTKVLMEVQLLQKLSHPNLVSYRHVWLESAKITTFGPTVPCAFILQQYCNSGDLHHYILDSQKPATKESLKDRLRRKSRGQPEPPQPAFNPRRLPFQQIISFFRDIAQGLNHLHTNGFIHRDLKPSNCLLHETGIPGEELKVLVSDFGEVQSENEMRASTGNTGTISYCAPEVLKRVSPNGAYENFTTKSDVFSLGMILHFLCFGKLPYVGADQLNEENEDLDALREEISAWQGLDDKAKIRTDLPERLYHSLKTLIHPDPAVRPSAEDILLGIEQKISGEAPPMRRGSMSVPKGGSEMDDSQALGFRRISPVADSPRSATPINPTDAAPHPDHAPAAGKGKPAPVAELRKAASVSKTASKLSQCEEPPTTPPPAPPPPAGEGEESSIILRPVMPAAAPEAASGGPPGGAGWRARMLGPDYMVVKITVFFVKVVSLTQPCMPVAPKLSVYYPVLGLAILDFTAPGLTPTVVLGAAHIALLLLIGIFGGGLCAY